ncbi:MAG: hypothetical protein ACI9IT_001795 [Glaciecola sp.]|jgi:hypothetical protein
MFMVQIAIIIMSHKPLSLEKVPKSAVMMYVHVVVPKNIRNVAVSSVYVIGR